MEIKSIKFETKADWDDFKTKSGFIYSSPFLIKKLFYPSLVVHQRKKEKTPRKEEQGHKLGLPYFTKEEGYYCSFDIEIEDFEEFKKKYKIKLKSNDKSFWWSFKSGRYKNCFFTSDIDSRELGISPIFIPSKGRWDYCKTADTLIELGIKSFYIIVEEEEVGKYAKNYPKENILILPSEYFSNYEVEETFKKGMSFGPGPARNFAWDYSKKLGCKAHWVIDDNVDGFVCFAPGNSRIPIKHPIFFQIAEKFFDIQESVKMGSLNYRFFCVSDRPLYILNTRMYSIIYIKNDSPVRWRFSRNEDTIISIDLLTKGFNTLMLNCFLANKAATQTIPGGNNSEIYQKKDLEGATGTEYKTKVLTDEYPQFAKEMKRYGRTHHFVDYKKHWKKPDFKPLSISAPDPQWGLYLMSPFAPICLI